MVPSAAPVRQAGQDAPDEQQGDVRGRDERKHPGGVSDQCGDQDRPAADVVREPATREQGCEARDRKDAVDRGERECFEPPQALIDAVERGGSTGGAQHQHEQHRDQPEASRPRQHPWSVTI